MQAYTGPFLPTFELALFAGMIKSALILAALGSIDSLLTSLVADNLTRTYHKSNRELIGQGIGNTVAGLDDFGTGLSSFGYLRTLPLDMIKIDAHFIQNLQQDQANQSIIKAINTIAHGFGIKTIAEGVENRCQLETLGTIGIDYVQGCLIENLSGL